MVLIPYLAPKNMHELLPFVQRFGKRLLRDRKNVDHMLDWIETSPEKFAEILKAFDNIIAKFNESSEIETSHTNTIFFKEFLGPNTLPTIAEMTLQGDFQSLLHLGRTFSRLNGMMHRGETTKLEPYVKFHTKTTVGPEALVVGSLFHFYEEHVLQHYGISLDRGVLEGALIETLSLLQDNMLWHFVSAKDQLNWVDGWKGFSKEFRNQLDFD